MQNGSNMKQKFFYHGNNAISSSCVDRCLNKLDKFLYNSDLIKSLSIGIVSGLQKTIRLIGLYAVGFILLCMPLPVSAQSIPEAVDEPAAVHTGQTGDPAQDAGSTSGAETRAEAASPEEYSTEEYFDAEETDLAVRFGGVVETAHSIQLMQPFEYSASRTFANLFADISFQNTSAHISAAAEYNHLTPQRTGFTLQEAYCTYRAVNWDICLGRQFIAWGQADGFRLTDRLTARDMREVIAVPDTKIASDAVKFRVLHDIFTLETVFVPFFTPDVLPPFDFEYAQSSEKPFFTIDTSAYPVMKKLEPARYPRRFIDTEAAARFAFFLPALDFSISGFYGWDKTPLFKRALHITGTIPVVSITPEYYRIGTIGCDAAIPVGDFVFRFETAYVFDKYFEASSHNTGSMQLPKPLKKNQLLLLAGLDWNRSGWGISMQYFEDLVFCKKDELERGIHEGTVSLNISKTLLRERLKIAASGLVAVTDGGTGSSYSVSYALSDLLTISGGADVYTKGRSETSTFSRMHTFTSGWLKARLSF